MADIAFMINRKRQTIGQLGRELAAVRAALDGKGPVTPGVQDPPQTDNESGNKKPPQPADPANPDASSSDIQDPDAPEILDGKELTPAQKAAQDLAFALGLHPDQKVFNEYRSGRQVKKAKREDRFAADLEKAAGTGGKNAELFARGGMAFRSKSEKHRVKAASLMRGKKSAEELAAEFYLERGEKNVGTAVPKNLAKRAFMLIRAEAQRQPLQTAIGASIGAASLPVLYAQHRNAKRQEKMFHLFGVKEAEVMAQRFYLEQGWKNFPPNDAADQGGPPDDGDQGYDPSEMESLRDKLELTPMEQELFDQLVSDGEGVDSVDAGMPPEQLVDAEPQQQAPPEPGTPKADNLPTNGMEMYGQAPVKPLESDVAQPAVDGQKPTDTNPGPDLEEPGVDKPEGATYQSEPTGSDTAEALPGMGTEMTQMLPGATRSTVQAPPMGQDEAREHGQTQDEAFASLVAKLERAQEQEQMDGKSLEPGEKGIISKLLMKAGGTAARFLERRGMRKMAGGVARGAARIGAGARTAERFAVSRAPNTVAYAKDASRRVGGAATSMTQRAGSATSTFASRFSNRKGASGFVARGLQKGGNFVQKNPRTSMAIGAAGIGAGAVQESRRREQKRRQLYGY